MKEPDTPDDGVQVQRQTAAVPAAPTSDEWNAVAVPDWDVDYPLESVVVANTVVAVARVGDAVYAFADECTHQRCSLSEGDVEDFVVTCPCHNGAFDVRTGEVVSGPPPAPIQTYDCRVEDNVLQIRVPVTHD
jgi:nitrite reductase/ring-hydroxylating ferredoxin subunit